MSPFLQIIPHAGTDHALETRIRTWAGEVLDRKGTLTLPPQLSIILWKSLRELSAFYQREKKELGVVTGEEADFLATHEAWRGYPRIHVCEEKVKDLPLSVLRGVLHHEIGHALHHGSPEFYTFRFSKALQEAGTSCGLDFQALQQCVYFLSIAIKDHDVVRWLSGIGLGTGQAALMEHMMRDTQEEAQVWKLVRAEPAPRKIVLAALLKTLLPVETLVFEEAEEARTLKAKWANAYSWLTAKEQRGLMEYTRITLKSEGRTFQEKLEEAALRLITDPSL